MSVADTVRHAASQVMFEEYPVLGFNYRMTDIQAAIGRVQLKRLSEILPRRIALAARYTQAISDISGLLPPHIPSEVRTNYQSYPMRVESSFPLTRDELMQSLLAAGVSTRRGIMNAHQEAVYSGIAEQSLTASEQARDDVILLPLFDALTDEQQDRVIDCCRSHAAPKKADCLATLAVGH
jgi:dTDP-4-amino-4,6-dideoxygalactose transaminase